FVFAPDFFAQAASFFFARAIETLLLAAFRLGLASGFGLALGGGGADSLTVGERDVRRLRARASKAGHQIGVTAHQGQGDHLPLILAFIAGADAAAEMVVADTKAAQLVLVGH